MRKMAEFEFCVQPMDVDFSESIRLTQMIGYLLHTAGLNADENGFGIQVLHAQDRAWVASRLALETYRYPKSHEVFRIETWIEDYGRVFTTRNFRITDISGSLIGAGSSIWCMLDMTTRKAVDLSSTDYAGFATGIPSPIDRPVKIPALNGEPVSRHRVKYSDIDFNRHTNSMKYIEWMTDLFPLELFLSREVRRIDINYVNEVLYGDKVDIFQQQQRMDGCLFEMRRDETVICRASMQFDGSYDLMTNK
jgi:acyl-ACP thioesterase